MPVTKKWSGLWDIKVNIEGADKLERVSSVNHPIKVTQSPTLSSALVELRESIDRRLVPCQDFVLYIRDASLNKPHGFSTMTQNQQQVISVGFVPALDTNEKSLCDEDTVQPQDICLQLEKPETKKENPQDEESKETEKKIEEADESSEEEDLAGEKRLEFIFLIDRSGSMYQTIKLAREALNLFLQSLPSNSKFNICSYGSDFAFLFDSDRSVEYNDANLSFALEKIGTFEADFGGTEIFSPLKAIFQKGKPSDCDETHIFLLTDGAVFNTGQVVNLIA